MTPLACSNCSSRAMPTSFFRRGIGVHGSRVRGLGEAAPIVDRLPALFTTVDCGVYQTGDAFNHGVAPGRASAPSPSFCCGLSRGHSLNRLAPGVQASCLLLQPLRFFCDARRLSSTVRFALRVQQRTSGALVCFVWLNAAPNSLTSD